MPPTAYITALKPFTNALNVSVIISFSEPCAGGGCFGCSSVNACNVSKWLIETQEYLIKSIFPLIVRLLLSFKTMVLCLTFFEWFLLLDYDFGRFEKITKSSFQCNGF